MYISCLKGQKKEEGENVLQFNNDLHSFNLHSSTILTSK